MTIETHRDLIEALGEEYLMDKLGAKKNAVQQWRSMNKLPKYALLEITFMRKYQNLKLGGIKGIKALQSGKDKE